MSILIITHSDDNESVALVAEAIARMGGHTIRFDTDRYPTEVRLTAYYGAGGRRASDAYERRGRV